MRSYMYNVFLSPVLDSSFDFWVAPYLGIIDYNSAP
jgi:hypothetical protein